MNGLTGPFKTEFSYDFIAHLPVSNNQIVKPQKAVPFNKANFIAQMKKYYLSQAFFVNSSDKIFKGKTMEEVIKSLKDRADQNPGGASEKTVKYYNLRGDWLELIPLQPKHEKSIRAIPPRPTLFSLPKESEKPSKQPIRTCTIS
jgi:hypothetical protein